MRILISLGILLLPLSTLAAEPLGRLFFTPEQRAQLDSLRTKKVVAAQAKDEPAPGFITYNGIIRRDDGKTTVWVNNKPLSEKDIRESASLVGRIERDGRILVQPGQGAAAPSLRLKVGQSAELVTGSVEESYAKKPINESVKAALRPEPQAKPEPTKPDMQPKAPPIPSLEELNRTAPADPAIQEKLRAMTDAARETPPSR